MVLLSNLDNINLDVKTSDFILEMFKKGMEHFNYKDLQIINDYRISNKLEPITKYEIESYIADLNSIILETETSKSLPF